MCSSLSAVSIACRWSRLLAALFTVLLSVPWVSVVQADDPLVAVLTAENWEQLVPQGKEVDCCAARQYDDSFGGWLSD